MEERADFASSVSVLAFETFRKAPSFQLGRTEGQGEAES